MFALSTSWNTNSKVSGKQIAQEIKNLGFDYLELAFSHTQEQIEQILKNQDIKIVSLHNYCPLPEGIPKIKALPDCYSLSSPNIGERKKAVEFTKRTIRLAVKSQAKAVILHCGRIEIADRTKQLINIREKEVHSCEFDSLKELALKERQDNKERFLDSIFLSIKELSDFAYDQGVAIGIENRIYIREIPDFSEIKIFLDNFSKKGAYFWYDTGHAYILDKLGFAKHTDYLKAYKENLIGVHFHDVDGFCDHRAPFTGEINFELFKPYIKKSTIKVIETHKPASPQEIIYSKQKLEKLFDS